MKKRCVNYFLALFLLSFSISFVSAACPIGLTGYWKLDGNFNDNSVNGNNGFCSGAGCPVSVTGKIGGAYSFDGVNDYVDLGRDIIGTGEISICAWIYPISWGGNSKGRIVNNDRAFLYVNNGNAPGKALSFTSDGVHYSASSKNSINLNEWSFVCFTRNSKGVPTYYINGALSNLGINGGGSPAAAITNTVIGGRSSAADRSFNGTIDEVAIYSRQLNAQEITSLYNNGNGKSDVCGAVVLPVSPTPTTPPAATVSTCSESWSCGIWGACNEGQQTRTCNDANSCGTFLNRPVLSQSCASTDNSTAVNATTSNATAELNNTNDNTNITSTCNDSDGGLNYYVRGTTRGSKFEAGTEGDDTRVTSSTAASLFAQDRWQDVSLGGVVDFNFGSAKVSKIQFYGLRDTRNSVEVEYSSLSDYCESDGNLIEFSCTSHGMDGYSYTCPNGCSNGACLATTQGEACSSLINKLKNHENYVYNGVNFELSWNSSNEITDWFDGKEHKGTEYYASWYAYDEGYKNIAYSVVVFDEKNIDLNKWLNQKLDYEVCQITSHGNDEEENYYYICNWNALTEEQSDDYQYLSRQVYWVKDNVAVQVYVSSGKSLTNEEVMQLSQKRMLQLMEDLQDNEAKYVSWESFDFDWILRGQIVDEFSNGCGSDVIQPINTETNQTCWPSWQCKLEPAICPEYGYQTRTCIDYSCNQEAKVTQNSCTPGMCSGCLIPRWFDEKGRSDNICMPYGFRFEQQTSWEKKFVEETGTERVKESSNNDYKLEVLSSEEALFTLYARGENRTYTLKINEPVLLDVTGWEEDISALELTATEIKFVSANSNDNYVLLDVKISGWDNVAESINAYCEVDGQVKQQKMKQPNGAWTTCQNNYECYSNLCSGGECVEINDMIKEVKGFKATGVKILCKLADVFGIEKYDSCLVGYLGEDYTSSISATTSSSGSGGGGSSSG